MAEKETLYELVGEWQTLWDMANDDDVDEDVLIDTMESVEDQIMVKAEGYLRFFDNLEHQASKYKAEADFLSAKAKEWKDKADRTQRKLTAMKDRLKYAMVLTDHPTIQAGPYTVKVVKNGGKQPLMIHGEVPEAWCKMTIEPDKDKIRDCLESGGKLDFAYLADRGTRLSIK